MLRRDPLLTSALAITAPAIARAQPPAGPRANPYLSAPVYGITHFNPAQTDTFPYPVRRGVFHVDPSRLPRIPGGPVNIMTLASTHPGFMWAISTDRVAYLATSAGTWTQVAGIALPGVRQVSTETLRQLLTADSSSLPALEAAAHALFGPQPAAVFTNGLYTLVDRDNVAYANVGATIHAFGLKHPHDPGKGLEIKRSFDASKVFPPMSVLGAPPVSRLVGMGMTYDGHLILGGLNGIAVVDRQFSKPAVVHVIENGQLFSNSFSVDERNGIYLASGSLDARGDGIMQKLIWTGSAISTAAADGAWSTPYQGGDWPPAIKAGTGTGSTPTPMGFGEDADRLVVITDGVNRMNLVAFWRDEIPADFAQKPGTKSRRIADQIAVTAALPAETAWIQSEQSVVVNGDGAFVVNNVVPNGHPDKLIDVLAIGALIEPPHGTQRFEWDRHARHWRSVWARGDVASTSMVPAASGPSGMVFVNGYSKADGWEVTGLDWHTGETVHRTVFGHDNLGNGAYAILQFLPDGDLLFNSVAGPFRVPLSRMNKSA